MLPAQIVQADYRRLDVLLLPGGGENLSDIFPRTKSFLRHSIVR